MLPLTFQSPAPLRLLCLGAHCDDIEIGCGGTVARLIAEGRVARVDWVVFASNPVRAEEARRGAGHLLRGAPHANVDVRAFRDGFFPYVGADVKAAFEGLKGLDPDVIFVHHRHDLHQDHRLMAELTWNTFRNHLVLEYEIPKYDGNPFDPNVYVPLDEPTCRRKVDAIMDAFATQRDKPWFTPDTFWATLRLRGIECASRYAEAFVCRKAVL